MKPVEITWEGSSDVITINRSDNNTFDAREPIAKLLTSQYPNFWPMEPDLVNGGMMTIDQKFKWMSTLNDVYNEGGIVLVARHTSNNNNLIAVAISRPVSMKPASTMLVQSTDGYEGARVDEEMLKAMRGQCQESGKILSRLRITEEYIPI